MTKISIGMDKQKVIATLHKNPDKAIGARKYPGGTIEVVEYAYGSDATGKEQSYWLYFYNDKLIQYGHPGNWEREADMIVADNGGH